MRPEPAVEADRNECQHPISQDGLSLADILK